MATQRTEEISPFIVMDVLERAHAMEKEGTDVIHLEVGEPDLCVLAAMTDLKVGDVWGGWFYCVEFRKPEE